MLLLADVFDISADLPRTIRPGPRSVLHQPGPFVGRLAQNDGRRTRATYRLRPASVHRKADARRYLDDLKAPRQSKQSMVEGYDPGRPSIHILYLDANNLYGWAMSQYLPTSGFRWADDCQLLAKNYRRSSSQQPRRLHTRGGPGVPRGLTRRAQFISVGT